MRKNVCNSHETGVRTRRAAIVNHPAVLKILRVVNLLRVVFLVRRGPLGQRIAKGAGGKGPRQKTSKSVKKCQKVFRHFSTVFAHGKKSQKSSKSVKKFFDTFRQFSRGTFFPAPFAIR